MLRANAFQLSMTQDGSPHANAVAERINGILKRKFGLDQVMLTPEQMHQQRSQLVRTYKKAGPKRKTPPDPLQTNF